MTRTSHGALGGEPLLGVVREDHPDVDIVILPPEQPIDLSAIPVSDPSTIESASDSARMVLADLRSVAGIGPATEQSERWMPRDGLTRLSCHVGEHQLSDGESVARLRRVGTWLQAQGWHVDPETTGWPRLSATDGVHTVEAMAVTSTIELTVLSRHLRPAATERSVS